jgi:hypothetical protein
MAVARQWKSSGQWSVASAESSKKVLSVMAAARQWKSSGQWSVDSGGKRQRRASSRKARKSPFIPNELLRSSNG